MNKKKIFIAAIAVCLVAIISMGSLAWFTDDDSVTNNFYVAGSEDQNPDDVFSIDVWEDKDPEDTTDEQKIQNGIEYPDILPGDDLYKEVNVENTGAYPQYARVIVTVSDAHIWQAIYGEVYISLDKIATDLSSTFKPWSIEFNADKDTLTYVLYYKKILNVDDVVTLFTNVHIPEDLDREQAAAMAGGFDINVVAEAVQTENVGKNAAEAFETVGMAIAKGNSTIMTTAEGLKNALISGASDTVVLNEAYAGIQTTIDYDVANVTIDAANQNVALVINGKMENVTVTNIKDNGDGTPALTVTGASGDLNVKDSYFYDASSQPYGAIAGANTSTALSLNIDGCTIEGARPLYLTNINNLTVTNTTFNGETGGSWTIIVNGTVNGNVKIDGCTFEGCTGIFKAGITGGQGNGEVGNVTFTNNVLNDNNQKNNTFFDVRNADTVTVSGNSGNTTEIVGWDSGLN